MQVKQSKHWLQNNNHKTFGYFKGYLTVNLFLTISQKIKGKAWKITESENIRWKILINLCWLRYNLVFFFFPHDGN